MALIDVVRMAWTWGFAVGAVLMLALLREVIIDVYALSISKRQPGINDLYSESVKGDVWVAAVLTAVLAIFSLSGAMSYAGQPVLTISLLLVGGALLISLGVGMHIRRRRVFAQIRLRRQQRHLFDDAPK